MRSAAASRHEANGRERTTLGNAHHKRVDSPGASPRPPEQLDHVAARVIARLHNCRPTSDSDTTTVSYRPAARPELGDTDESLWDADEDGKPIDPWSFTNTIPFKNPATGQEFTFTTSSRGGTSAVGKLCSVYGQQRQQHEGQLPIIELQTSSYRHKRFGEVYIPVLRLVGWQCEAELSSSGAAEPDLNDDLPPGF